MVCRAKTTTHTALQSQTLSLGRVSNERSGESRPTQEKTDAASAQTSPADARTHARTFPQPYFAPHPLIAILSRFISSYSATIANASRLIPTRHNACLPCNDASDHARGEPAAHVSRCRGVSEKCVPQPGGHQRHPPETAAGATLHVDWIRRSLARHWQTLIAGGIASKPCIFESCAVGTLRGASFQGRLRLVRIRWRWDCVLWAATSLVVARPRE